MQTSNGSSQTTTQAYLYGFPLVFNLDQVTRYVTEGVGANPAAPFNSFSHARKLAAQFTVTIAPAGTRRGGSTWTTPDRDDKGEHRLGDEVRNWRISMRFLRLARLQGRVHSSGFCSRTRSKYPTQSRSRSTTLKPTRSASVAGRPCRQRDSK